MKILLLITVALYGIVNLFAGLFDLLEIKTLPLLISVLLLISGLLLFLTFYFIFKEKQAWFQLVIIALIFPATIAVYNQQFLNLGHAADHVYRGIYSLFVLTLAYFLKRKTYTIIKPHN